MPWDINGDLNPAIRFDDDEGKEWIKVRVPSEEDNRRFFKAAGIKEKIEYKTNRNTRQMERLVFFDSTEEQRNLFNEEQWDFMIPEWNLITLNGDIIPCTRENKILMMRQSPQFSAWVNGCFEKAKEGMDIHKEELEKN